MSQGAAIAIALLLEALLIVSAVAGVLGWRLGRRRAAEPPAEGALQSHFRAELDALSQTEPTEDGALRQRVLQGELKALDLQDPVARQAHFAELYAASDDESARLRRLLQREAKRVGELLEIRDVLRELKLGYQRLQRIFTQLVDPELDPAERERMAETFPSQETAWAEQLDRLLARLEGATEELEDENNYLYQQLCEARDGGAEAGPEAEDRAAGPRPDTDELEQALAMKDREIEELKGRLGASMASLAGDEPSGVTRNNHEGTKDTKGHQAEPD